MEKSFRFKALISEMLKSRDRKTLTLLTIFILLILFMWLVNPMRFPTLSNFQSMTIQMSDTGVLSLAFFVVIVCGGFNLSTVAVANLSAICMGTITTGIILSEILVSDISKLIVGILVALLVGIICGLFNGFFVSKLKLDSVLVTAATMQFLEGVSVLITRGKSIVGGPSVIIRFGGGRLFGIIPNLFVVMIVCFILASVYLNMTKFGEQSKLLGFNAVANRYSGNNNEKTLFVGYMISGFFSAIAGMMIYAKMGILKADYGSTLGGTMFLVVLLGGAMLAGGGGKIINILISLASLQVISSGFALGGLTPNLKQFTWGTLLLIVIISGSDKFHDYYKRRVNRWFKHRSTKD